MASRTISQMLGVLLPFYAATNLGGVRVGLIFLLANASGIPSYGTKVDLFTSLRATWHTMLRSRSCCLALLGYIVVDALGLQTKYPSGTLLRGYLALAASILFFSIPLPATSSPRPSVVSPTSAVPSAPWETPVTSKPLEDDPEAPEIGISMMSTSLRATAQNTHCTRFSVRALLRGDIIHLQFTHFEYLLICI